MPSRPCVLLGVASCAGILLATWALLGAYFLRAEVLGHTSLIIHHVAGSIAGTLHAPDPAPASLHCARSFDPATGFGPDGPRLWLWWTSPLATPGELDMWMARECFESMQRHAAPALRVAIVNSSATRGAGARFPLRRFPLPAYFDALPVNHQGDFGSIAMLAEYGGVYLDTDVLVLHDLAPWVDLLARYDFVGFGGHSFDEGVHHGLMAARPGAEINVRAYHAALAAYAEEGGCAGDACARVEGLGWLSTLNAFAREASLMRADAGKACAYARFPTRHYEPGVAEHQDLCLPEFEEVLRPVTGGGPASEGAIAPGETWREAPAVDATTAARFVVSTMAAAVVGTLRVVHLSVSKRTTARRFPDWRGQPLAHCPLVGYLANVSAGVADVRAAQRVGTGALDAWQQRVGDFGPGGRRVADGATVS